MRGSRSGEIAEAAVGRIVGAQQQEAILPLRRQMGADLDPKFRGMPIVLAVGLCSLIYAAFIAGGRKAEDETEEDILRTLAVNVQAPIVLAQAVFLVFWCGNQPGTSRWGSVDPQK